MDEAKEIFGNKMSNKVFKKSVKTKKKYIRKFGDESKTIYHLSAVKNTTLGDSLGIMDLNLSDKPLDLSAIKNPFIVGNIRMGFGHYRISMAMASCAHALGYTPLWFDLNSYKDSVTGKIINHGNELYSMGSRWSQKYKLFNKFVWEPLNSEGFRQLSYNSGDQKVAELYVPLYNDLPKNIPFVATHAWPSQGAIHAGLTNVVNAIPDNWPMALHLSEGSIHTVQTESSYLGYKTLNGMQKDKINKPMPDKAIKYVGHYIDHELVSNIDYDNSLRLNRLNSNSPVRILLSVGGAGAQGEIFRSIINHLLPLIKEDKVALFINVGDHKNVWDELKKDIPGLNIAKEFINKWEETKVFAKESLEGEVKGIYAFSHDNIFEAVYSSNLLMRCSDVLATKPSELAFYPVPKLMIKRVGGHEAWGAIHAAELGDGTSECTTIPKIIEMLDLMVNEKTIITNMCNAIIRNKNAGIYDGAYEIVKILTGTSK